MKRTTTLLATSALFAVVAGMAQAAGTAPGTAINNTFDLSYNSGGDSITITDVGQASITVDRRVSFTFASSVDTPTTVTANKSGVDMTFVVTNTGNADTTFDIDIAQTYVNSNGLELVYDVNGGPGTWFAAIYDPAVGPQSAAPYDPTGINGFLVPADDSRIVMIVADIPDTDDGKSDRFDLTLRPTNGGSYMVEDRDGNGTDLVFADAGADGTESGFGSYLLQAPQLTAYKEVFVVNEMPAEGFLCASQGTAMALDEGAFLPGACLEYVITVQNDAAASLSAGDVKFTDLLPGNLIYQGNFSNGIGIIPPAQGSQLVQAEVTEAVDPGDTVSVRIRVLMQ